MELSKLISKYNDPVIASLNLTEHQRKVFSDIEVCRSPVLGAHWYLCPDCGHDLLLFNSCRNRNCPTCQGNKRKTWIEKECEQLLDVPYYHVVFTVPEALNGLFIFRPKLLYQILFTAAWQTVQAFFADSKFFGGTGGMLSVLHTWGQTLTLHPHLHCLIPGAGLDADGNFKIMHSNGKYLFPVKAMSKVFRAKFTALLTKEAKRQGFVIPPTVRALMFAKPWVVFCKRPFAKPQFVVNYLGRYTYRTAIAQQRIISDHNGTITFTYKDYKTQGTHKNMSLDAGEFFRRFALHILPKRIVKIRRFGQLANSNKKAFFEKANQNNALYSADNKALPQITSDNESLQDQYAENQPFVQTQILCPHCKTGHLIKVFPLHKHLFDSGFSITNILTAEIVFQYNPRDGPQNPAPHNELPDFPFKTRKIGIFELSVDINN